MLPLYIFDDICKQLDFPEKDESSGSRLTTLSLVWFLRDVKEPTPLFEKTRGRTPQWFGQAFLGWVGYP